MTNKRGGPLQGVRVVELTKVWAGPYVGKLLAYLGAEVIRVESMGSLDVTRIYGVEDMNNAPGFKSVNAEKLSVQINMKSEEGISILLDLIKESDILVENLRPGAVKRLGLGYDTVKQAKPDIVYVSMGMFGNEGPLSYQTGYAPCFAALSGFSALVGYQGEPPAGMNVRYADSTFGAAAAYAATIALLHRRKTGEGQFIDVSAVEAMTSMIGDGLMDYMLNGSEQQCQGNRHSEMAPHGVFPCQNNEWLVLAVKDDAAWQALAEAMGQPELASDARFQTLAARKANEDELEALLSAWTAGGDAAELAMQLQQAGIAASKSLSSLDLIADPTLWMRGFYQEVTDQQGRNRSALGPSWKMSRMATVTQDAPALGQHNDYILGEVLGLSEAERERLVTEKVTF